MVLAAGRRWAWQPCLAFVVPKSHKAESERQALALILQPMIIQPIANHRHTDAADSQETTKSHQNQQDNQQRKYLRQTAKCQKMQAGFCPACIKEWTECTKRKFRSETVYCAKCLEAGHKAGNRIHGHAPGSNILDVDIAEKLIAHFGGNS